MAKVKSVASLSYEDALAELESVLGALEQGELPLDDTVQLFERGKSLLDHCRDLLDKAELKVSELSGDSDSSNDAQAVE